MLLRQGGVVTAAAAGMAEANYITTAVATTAKIDIPLFTGFNSLPPPCSLLYSVSDIIIPEHLR
jgi:hypothetical protein